MSLVWATGFLGASSEESSDEVYFFFTGCLATALAAPLGGATISSEDSSDEAYCFLFFGAGFATGFAAPLGGTLTSYSEEDSSLLAMTGFLAAGLSTEPFLTEGLGADASSSTDALDPFLGALAGFFWIGVSSSLSSF